MEEYITEDIDIDDIGDPAAADPGGSILPAQWPAGPAAWNPEQRLYAELMYDALRALVWGAGRRESSRRWVETIDWLNGAETTVTWEQCCRALDLDPQAARAGIYRRITEFRRANLARRPIPPRRRRPARPAAKSPARPITRKVESAQQLALLPPLPGPPRPARVRRPRPAAPSTQLSFDFVVREPAARLAA